MTYQVNGTRMLWRWAVGRGRSHRWVIRSQSPWSWASKPWLSQELLSLFLPRLAGHNSEGKGSPLFRADTQELHGEIWTASDQLLEGSVWTSLRWDQSWEAKPLCFTSWSSTQFSQWTSGKRILRGFPAGSVGEESACQCRRCRFNPWSGKIPHAAERRSPWATSIEPMRCKHWSLSAPESTVREATAVRNSCTSARE